MTIDIENIQRVGFLISLPQWLQDNDFLHFGHRPPLPTIECFKSIIRIHTETEKMLKKGINGHNTH